VGQKALEDTRLTVMSRELATNVTEIDLDTSAVELVEREKLLAERQMQELVVAQKRLEELQASRAGEAQRVWEFLG
jgi:predicted kinase